MATQHKYQGLIIAEERIYEGGGKYRSEYHHISVPSFYGSLDACIAAAKKSALRNAPCELRITDVNAPGQVAHSSHYLPDQSFTIIMVNGNKRTPVSIVYESVGEAEREAEKLLDQKKDTSVRAVITDVSGRWIKTLEYRTEYEKLALQEKRDALAKEAESILDLMALPNANGMIFPPSVMKQAFMEEWAADFSELQKKTCGYCGCETKTLLHAIDNLYVCKECYDSEFAK